MWGKQKIGLVLGAGGARGVAHIGVLKVFQSEGIPVDLIVGASIGALVGAAYAVNPDSFALEQRVCKVLSDKEAQNPGLKRLQRIHRPDPPQSDLIHRLARIAEKEVFLNLAIVRNALLSEKDLRECVEVFLPDMEATDTAIPFAATAVDLVSGREVILDQGSLVRAVMASCATPGFMPPISWNEMLLVDGGIVGNLPIEPARTMGADLVIGVDVGASIDRPRFIEDGIDVIHRTTEIMGFYLNQHRREAADLIIEPAVKEKEWTDFLDHEKIIKEGEAAALSKIPEIRRLLKPRLSRKVIPWPQKWISGLRNHSLLKALPVR
ncbi:MAG: patatin-like phospholipase family protein [Deltaproteobacteria bacterium]|nr:patatin-like phospholipase family protein [Deltaproteobacteria bacterium]MBW2154453.1 patatin-like phospholipase family protein [Deltaproteobacteria bacterium]